MMTRRFMIHPDTLRELFTESVESGYVDAVRSLVEPNRNIPPGQLLSFDEPTIDADDALLLR